MIFPNGESVRRYGGAVVRRTYSASGMSLHSFLTLQRCECRVWRCNGIAVGHILRRIIKPHLGINRAHAGTGVL